MKKLVLVVIAAMAMLLGSAGPSDARDDSPRPGHPVIQPQHPRQFFRPGHRFFFHHGFIGPRVFIGPQLYWSYPPYYSYPYYPPPVVVEPPPQVYVQPQAPEQYYWYYCENSKTYYPYVQQCPGGWIQVLPRTAPPEP